MFKKIQVSCHFAKRLPVACLALISFFVCPLFGQQTVFRGQVAIKSYDLMRDVNTSTIAGVLMMVSGWDHAAFDTIYNTFYICDDTIISEISGTNRDVLRMAMIIGDSQFIRSSSGEHYIKIPLNRHQSLIGTSKPTDWKKNKKGKKVSRFFYDYSLLNPDNKIVRLYAVVDETTTYDHQFSIGGMYRNIFHHLGKYDTLIVDDGRTISLWDYTYYEDLGCNCQEKIANLPVDDVSAQEVEEVTSQFMDKGTDSIIDRKEREPFVVLDALPFDDRMVDPVFTMEGFQGKHVLVDVWASWCPPCRAEIPYLNDLREHYGDELVILSISLDGKEGIFNWEQAIESLRMNWPNWIIYGGFESDFANRYNIETLPRYFVIDPEGKIVNDNAPKPSNDASKSLLDKLIMSTSGN